MEAQAKLDDLVLDDRLDPDAEGALAGALLRSRLLSQGGLTTRSLLAPNPVVSIALAARRALADIEWDASSEEVCEEREAAARVRSVLNQTEVLECAGMQALMLADGSNGVGADGSMGQCFFCNNYSNCETNVIVCASCICVFHDRCLELRGVQIPEGDEPLTSTSCPVCVERTLAERDPANHSVLALTARGSQLRAELDAEPSAAAPMKRQRRKQAAEALGTSRRSARLCRERASVPATLVPALATVSPSLENPLNPTARSTHN